MHGSGGTGGGPGDVSLSVLEMLPEGVVVLDADGSTAT
jgi:hypothetical protein